ncbi:MAG TPA: hypothetical protein VGF73_08725 [Chthoniobacterales bacterium]|jgi:hypothetical protein
MNLKLARKILAAAAAQPGGCLKLRGRTMVHEARMMEEEGWLQLAGATSHGSTAVATLTEMGRRVGGLFKDEAIADRLRSAFLPRRSEESR